MSRHHARHKIGGERWIRTTRQVKDRDGWRCQRCGAAGRLEVHHRTPLAEGGDPWALENLETVCRSCHVAAHRRPLTEAETAWWALVDELY